MPHIAPIMDSGTVLLADLYRTAFTIKRPLRQTAPFVLASPHSGRWYPDSFLAASRIGMPDIRRSEDAFADILFDGVTNRVAMLSARFPRAFLDVNRRETELDPALFEGPLRLPIEFSAHVAAGFGVIPRIVREGVTINRYKMAALDAEERLQKLHRPYHRALAGLMAQTRATFGCAILIDCHTMPRTPGAADIVIGDRYGTSAPARLVELIEKRFASEGFSVARNTPFAGGYCTSRFGSPEESYYAVQIEVHRPLYLNEESVTPAPGFAAIQKRIGTALTAVLAAAQGRLGMGRTNRPQAAE